MRDHGWTVITVDIDPRFGCTLTLDIRQWSYQGNQVDFIWASPPCNEFSREFLPWKRTGRPPDLTIYEAVKRIIGETHPRYWIIENVRGAVPYFGQYQTVYYPYYLWGHFPPLHKIPIPRRHKDSYSSSARALRSLIPYALSLEVQRTIQGAIEFP